MLSLFRLYVSMCKQWVENLYRSMRYYNIIWKLVLDLEYLLLCFFYDKLLCNQPLPTIRIKSLNVPKNQSVSLHYWWNSKKYTNTFIQKICVMAFFILKNQILKKGFLVKRHFLVFLVHIGRLKIYYQFKANIF